MKNIIPEITNNEDLEPGKHYHCFLKLNGIHSIHKCETNDGIHKFISSNTIWAEDSNNQALTRWRIFGPIAIPYINSIYLCSNHGGHGFITDCTVCGASK